MENLILYIVPVEEGTEAHLLGSVELMIKDDSMFSLIEFAHLNSNGYFNGKSQ